MESSPTLRADARRNYEELIRVARKHLRHRGVSTSLEAIAREAGVGVGTLYRHFPDRNHLVFAALNAEAAALQAASERIRETVPEAAQLERWLSELENYLNSYHGLPDTMAQALARGECPTAISYQEIVRITETFLETARKHDVVQEWVTAPDLFRASLMLAWLNTQVPDEPGGVNTLRRMLRTGWSTPELADPAAPARDGCR